MLKWIIITSTYVEGWLETKQSMEKIDLPEVDKNTYDHLSVHLHPQCYLLVMGNSLKHVPQHP